MRIAFLGTPEFAVPSLKMLIEEGHELAVFTQPNRPKGRGYSMVEPPVKVVAKAHGIPVFQFEKIKRSEGVVALKEYAPELMVTAAFGQLLSAENLSVPKYGCINVHGSLLPKYRGAAPIQWAVINGEQVTGITTMLTDIGMDTGDILLMRETDIDPNETAGELSERLAVMGAEVLRDTIDLLAQGNLKRTQQDSSAATYCKPLTKEQGRVDFNKSAKEIHDLIRGVNPWPGAFCFINGSQLKLWRVRVVAYKGSAAPGECILADPKSGLIVAVGEDAVEILELQAPGKNSMDAKSFLRGKPLNGACFK